MSSHISLKQKGYVSTVKTNTNNSRDIIEIVDEIAQALINKNSKLITDISKGLIGMNVLEQQVDDYIDKNRITLRNEINRDEVIKKVKQYLFGYGILQELINSKTISDIKVINENNVRIKEFGRRKSTNIRFPSKKSLENFANYLANKNGGSLNDLSAVQRLSDDLSHPDFLMRLDICVKPVATASEAVIEIRKLPRDKPLLLDLLEQDMFNLEMYIYFLKAVKSKLKILWCGGGGSGKTTLMNACLEPIPYDESTVAIQEVIELHSDHPDIIFEQIREKKGENGAEYTFRYLTQNALVQDVDRIIISETKGDEAYDLFNASYTGHIVWTGVHAESAEKAIPKLIHYMKGSGTDYSTTELKKMLSEIDLVIFMKNYKCVEVIEVAGFNEDTNEIDYNPVFKFFIKKQRYGTLEGYFKRINKSCGRIQQKFDIADFRFDEEGEYDNAAVNT